MKTEEEIQQKIKDLDDIATKIYLQGNHEEARMYNYCKRQLEWVLEE